MGLAESIRKLRPAKVRLAAKRRWFEYRVPRAKMRPIGGLQDIGSRPGGWLLPVDLIEPSWLCYMVGAGGDVKVDTDLIKSHGVRVRSFDPVMTYVTGAEQEADGLPGFTAQQAAIAAKDGTIRMQVTHQPDGESVSAAGLYESSTYVEAPARTIPTLMKEAGDQQVELLKIDIEGSEYEVLPTLDLRALGVKVFAVQLHHTGTVGEARRTIAGIEAQGYPLVGCRPAVKLTFVREDLL